MNAFITYLFSDYRTRDGAQWLRRLLYLFMLIKCVAWLSQSALFFGPDGIVTIRHVSFPFYKAAAFWLLESSSLTTARFVLAICILLSLCGLFVNHFRRLITFLLWIFLVNINNAIYPTLTGGDFLFQQLMFFAIFLSDGNARYTEADRAFHNTGVIAIKIQICLVYLLSAIAKLTDEGWLSGEALFYTLSVHDFSLPFIYDHLHHNSWFLSLSTYTVLIYQLSFPFLIWFVRIKQPLLAFGIFQHLFIAFILGLPTFGFIMIISYSIFYVPAFGIRNSS